MFKTYFMSFKMLELLNRITGSFYRHCLQIDISIVYNCHHYFLVCLCFEHVMADIVMYLKKIIRFYMKLHIHHRFLPKISIYKLSGFFLEGIRNYKTILIGHHMCLKNISFLRLMRWCSYATQKFVRRFSNVDTE